MKVWHFFLLAIPISIIIIMLKRGMTSKMEIKQEQERKSSTVGSPYITPESNLEVEELKAPVKSGRHWAQYLFGLPFVFLAIFGALFANPGSSPDREMSQVDTLNYAVGLLGTYTPAILFLAVGLIILKRRKPKVSAP